MDPLRARTGPPEKAREGGTTPVVFVPRHLDPAKDQQDHDDENGDSQAAGWVVTPVSTMRPTWKSAYQSENQYDDEYSS
jgi:hypothetical protein